MFVFEEMKTNRFKDVKIPKKAEFYKRSGFIEDNGMRYGGEETTPTDGRQLDDIKSMLEHDAKMAAEEEK